jgi:peroxiredoxin
MKQASNKLGSGKMKARQMFMCGVMMVTLVGCLETKDTAKHVSVQLNDGAIHRGTVIMEDTDNVTLGKYETITIARNDVKKMESLTERPRWTARPTPPPVAAPQRVVGPQKPQVGDAALPFSVVDIEGNTHTDTSYPGEVVVLHFWATWCPFCRKSIPDMTALYEEHHGNGLRLVTISTDRDKATLEAFVQDENVPYPVAHGPDVAGDYGVSGIPMTVVIDQEGVIRDVQSGFGQGFLKTIDELLAS